ncbi:uncharacterized protein LOC123246347 [Gracilinanus agilis]|uniref:uncharacterized protein LOC123246347 n=1 Tax=Gracilinanus agilis TaxID=191870 RepID=UPI001CFCD95F|nr:uncharacterized protein LOC123246347 [Gracilinanus agilis]
MSFSLSRLCWAKSTQDPRIAMGHQSPLEKKIVSLGGLHTPASRNLLAQRHKEENESLSREKAMSFDYQLAKAETYYYSRIMEMVNEKNEFKKPRIELLKSSKSQKNAGAEEWDYLVPERELQQIESHIRRAEQARSIKDSKCKSLSSIPNKIHFPKLLLPESKRNAFQNTPPTRKKVREWERDQQTKEHLERMNRGRECNEERAKERLSVKIPNPPPPIQKHIKKKNHKMYEWNTAYPLLQPQDGSPIEVDILVQEPEKKDVRKNKKRKEKNFSHLKPVNADSKSYRIEDAICRDLLDKLLVYLQTWIREMILGLLEGRIDRQTCNLLPINYKTKCKTGSQPGSTDPFGFLGSCEFELNLKLSQADELHLANYLEQVSILRMCFINHPVWDLMPGTGHANIDRRQMSPSWNFSFNRGCCIMCRGRVVVSERSLGTDHYRHCK